MAFIGVKLPHEIARLLSEIKIKGEPASVDEFHVTMIYLGKDVPIDQVAKALVAAYEVTSQTPPFTMQTSMVTSFPPHPEDGVPIIARIESPALQDLRARLVASFQKHGVKFSNKHPDYKPHVTLGYSKDPLVDADKAADKQIPLVEWGVGEMVLWGSNWGDGRVTITFPFSLQQKLATKVARRFTQQQ